MNKYEARWNNAVKIANKINDYIDKGYLVFDEDNELTTNKFEIDKDDNGYYCICLPSTPTFIRCYFIKDMELDNGYYTTIKEYNKQFKDWKVVHPKHVNKLNLK